MTHLGRIALGFEGAEKSLLCAEDLYRAGWVLAKVGQGARVANEAGADALAKESGETGGDEVHFLGEVGREGLAVVGDGDDARGEGRDVEHVDVGERRAHGTGGGVDDVLRSRGIVAEEGGEVGELVDGEGLLCADEFGDAGVLVVVWHELDEFGKVVAVPLAYAHGEEVDVLVELVEESDGLDDHVVDAVHVELYLRARVGMAEAELGLGEVVGLQTFEQLRRVEADAADEFRRRLGGVALDVESAFDGVGQDRFRDA